MKTIDREFTTATTAVSELHYIDAPGLRRYALRSLKRNAKNNVRLYIADELKERAELSDPLALLYTTAGKSL